ncbi:MAG: hypothetical protein HY858_16575 [Candidatus Solibacter usitatus]|nr:hypothetical protein [Candidatus Solibacter usitatus]
MTARKTYFADTVEAAMAAAGRELGDDALLIESQPAPPERRRLGAYEVTFEAAIATLPQPAGDAPPAAGPAEPAAQGASQAEVLRAEIAALTAMVTQLTSLTAPAILPKELLPAAALLAEADVPADLALALIAGASRRLGDFDPGRTVPAEQVRAALAAEAESRLRCDPGLGRQGASRAAVALIGPPGAGKTVTLVKLAVRHAVAMRRPAVILTTDTCRVAAADQLRSFSAILGLPFEVVENASALARAMQEHRAKELVLIDTPGFSPGEWEMAEHWAAMLEGCGEIESQLVLPATMRSSDVRRGLARWRTFKPSRLIFTRLDETPAAGACLTAAQDFGQPISWLCAGQRIPEDLAPASTSLLLQLLLDAGGPRRPTLHDSKSARAAAA